MSKLNSKNFIKMLISRPDSNKKLNYYTFSQYLKKKLAREPGLTAQGQLKGSIKRLLALSKQLSPKNYKLINENENIKTLSLPLKNELGKLLSVNEKSLLSQHYQDYLNYRKNQNLTIKRKEIKNKNLANKEAKRLAKEEQNRLAQQQQQQSVGILQ